MDSYHQPVLVKELVEGLEIEKGSWYLDCTLGDGGYGVEIIKLGGKYFGMDQDPQALERTNKRFSDLGFKEGDFELLRGNFKDLKDLVGDQSFAGVIFDLGVSSLQLEDTQRGFSFSREAMLDMRID